MAPTLASSEELAIKLLRRDQLHSAHRVLHDAVLQVAVSAAGKDESSPSVLTPDVVVGLAPHVDDRVAARLAASARLLAVVTERLQMVDLALHWHRAICHDALGLSSKLPPASLADSRERFIHFLCSVIDDGEYAVATGALSDLVGCPKREWEAWTRRQEAEHVLGQLGTEHANVAALRALVTSMDDVPLAAARRMLHKRATNHSLVSPALANLLLRDPPPRCEDLEAQVQRNHRNPYLWWRLSLSHAERRQYARATHTLTECASAVRVLASSTMPEDKACLTVFTDAVPLFMVPLLYARVSVDFLGETEEGLMYAATARALAEEELEQLGSKPHVAAKSRQRRLSVALAQTHRAAAGGTGGMEGLGAAAAGVAGVGTGEDAAAPAETEAAACPADRCRAGGATQARAGRAAAASGGGPAFPRVAHVQPSGACIFGMAAACSVFATAQTRLALRQPTYAERQAGLLEAVGALQHAQLLLAEFHARSVELLSGTDSLRPSTLLFRLQHVLESQVGLQLGTLHALASSAQEALQCARDVFAVALGQGEPRVAALLALLLSGMGKEREALETCQVALRRERNSTLLLFVEAMLAARLEGPGIAVKLMESALAHARDDVAAAESAPSSRSSVTLALSSGECARAEEEGVGGARGAVEGAGVAVGGADEAGHAGTRPEEADSLLGPLPSSLPVRMWTSVVSGLGAPATVLESRRLLVRVACELVGLRLAAGASGEDAQLLLPLLDEMRSHAEATHCGSVQADVEFHAAQVLRAARNAQGAYAALQTAISLDAWHAQSLTALGEHHYRTSLVDAGSGGSGGSDSGSGPATGAAEVVRPRELDKAQAYLSLAVRADSSSSAAWHLLGLVLNAQKKPQSASAALLTALESERASPVVPYDVLCW